MTFIGHEAGFYCTTASYATAVGRESLKNLTTGITNTALGVSAGSNITTDQTAPFLVQALRSASTATNEITLGNSSATKLRIPGMQTSSRDGHVLTYNHSNGYISLAAPSLNDSSSGFGSIGLSESGTALDAEQSSESVYNIAIGDDALQI